MANYEQKPGTGSIFKNEYKQQDNHPDYRGSILTPSGEELELSCWVKKSQTGRSYFSVSVQEPYKKKGEQPVQDSTPPPPATPADDLPF